MKNFFLYSAIFLLVASITFMFGYAPTRNAILGNVGNGTDGKSAYELAVDNGFDGTLDEWLESLRGSDGQDGTNGTDGVDGTDGQNAIAEYILLIDNELVMSGNETFVVDEYDLYIIRVYDFNYNYFSHTAILLNDTWAEFIVKDLSDTETFGLYIDIEDGELFVETWSVNSMFYIPYNIVVYGVNFGGGL